METLGAEDGTSAVSIAVWHETCLPTLLFHGWMVWQPSRTRANLDFWFDFFFYCRLHLFIYLLTRFFFLFFFPPFLLSSKLLRFLWETAPLRLYQGKGWQHLLKQNLQVKVAKVIWNENARTVILGNFAVFVEWPYMWVHISYCHLLGSDHFAEV